MTTARASWLGRIPAPWLVIGAILSVQVGAAIAKGLFDQVSPTGMVWLRLATSTMVFLAVAHPQLRGRTPRDWAGVAGYGLCLGLMNWAIYQSFARIPLGLAVTIEFLGPLAVAVFGSRRLRDLLWALLAGLGVALLGFGPTELDPVGIAYALLAAAGWAGYILTGRVVGRRWEGVSGLAVGSTLAMLALTAPALLETGAGRLWQPHVLMIGAAVGLLSSVIPYSLELTALRRMPARVFGVLMSLEPAAAALAALILLGEVLSAREWVAMACVVIASIGATRVGARATRPEPL